MCALKLQAFMALKGKVAIDDEAVTRTRKAEIIEDENISGSTLRYYPKPET
jgi:hypothetical protein